jgi:hypothetical protein
MIPLASRLMSHGPVSGGAEWAKAGTHRQARSFPRLRVVVGLGAEQFADSLAGLDDRRGVQAARGAG